MNLLLPSFYSFDFLNIASLNIVGHIIAFCVLSVCMCALVYQATVSDGTFYYCDGIEWLLVVVVVAVVVFVVVICQFVETSKFFCQSQPLHAPQQPPPSVERHRRPILSHCHLMIRFGFCK